MSNSAKRRIFLATAGCLSVVATNGVKAATRGWVGNNSNFLADPSNWSTTIPGANDLADFDIGGLTNLVQFQNSTDTLSAATFAFNSLGSTANPNLGYIVDADPSSFGFGTLLVKTRLYADTGFGFAAPCQITINSNVKFTGTSTTNEKLDVGTDPFGGNITITTPLDGSGNVKLFLNLGTISTNTINLAGGLAATNNDQIRVTGSAGKVILGSSVGYDPIVFLGSTGAGLELTSNTSLGSSSDPLNQLTQIGGGASNSGAILLTGGLTGVQEFFDLDQRAGTAAHFVNETGTNVLAGSLELENGANSGSTDWTLQSDGTAAGDLLQVTGSVFTTSLEATTAVGSTLNLQGAGNGLISSNITEGVFNATTNTFGITKSGGGTWTLAGNNTYSGATNVAGGKLLVTGTHTGGGNYAVQSGATLAIGSGGSIGIGTATSQTFDVITGGTLDVTAVSGGYSLASGQTLSGGGSVLGGLKLTSGSTISPGEGNVVGSLAIGSLTTTGGGTLRYVLPNAPSGTNDKIVVNGNLSLSGTTTVAYIGAATSGSYHLIDYTGALSGSSANFTLLSQNPGTTGTSRPSTFAVNTSVAHQVTLDVTGGAGNLTWVGGQNSNAWDLINTVNWTGAPGASPDNRFYTGDLVTFASTGSTSPTINIQGTQTAGKVTFNNGAGHDYTLGGSGDIVDAGDFVASNAGNVTLNQSGFTVTGTFNYSGSGNLNIANNSAALFSGSFLTSASGNLTISSIGGATLNGGMSVGGSGNVTINTTDFAVVNTFTDNSTGTVTIANTGTLILPAAVALNSGTLAFARPDSFTVSSAISGAGTLRKDGVGTMTLTANNSSLSGPIVVANGTLRMNKGLTTALGGASSTTTVNSGGALDLNGTKFTTRVVTLAGSGPAGAPIQGALIDGSNSGVTSNSFSQVNGVILAADATIGVSNSFLNITGTGASFQGNSHNLTVIGAGAPLTNEVDLTGVGETHLTNVTVDGAALFFNGSSTLGDQPGVVTCQNGGIIAFDGIGGPVTKNIVISSNGGGGIQTFNSDTTIAGPVEMDGNAEFEINSGASYSGSGATTLINTTLTLAGNVIGNGNLNVHDNPRLGGNTNLRPGTVALTSNSNSYTGGTTIGGGGGFSGVTFGNDQAILSVGNGGTTGMIPVGSDINNNGTLLFNRNDTFTVPNHIGGIGTVTFAASNGYVTLSGPNDYAGKTIVQAGTVELTSNAQAPIFQGTGTDIQKGRIVFDYGSGSTLPTDIRGDLIASYNDAAFTDTGGEFFGSSTAVAGATGLGEYDDGVSKVSVAATYYGDANLDGIVNALDFNALATNYGSSAGIWQKGDFNYDGSVNSADFDALAANFGQALPTSAEPVGAEMALGALVPEPTSLGLLGLAACGMLSRRRRAAISR